MLKKLTVAQRAAYDENGYVDRIDIFTASEIEEIVAELAEAEAAFGHELDAAGRNNAHYVLPVLDRITHDPRILDAVEDIIGRIFWLSAPPCSSRSRRPGASSAGIRTPAISALSHIVGDRLGRSR